MAATPDLVDTQGQHVTNFTPAPAPTRNAWGAAAATAASPAANTTSLADVMSEQLAGDLAKKEDAKLAKTIGGDEGQQAAVAMEAAAMTADDDEALARKLQQQDTEECKDDLLIAQMLQMQFDQEYDEGVKREEAHHNKSAKVSVSYSKYRVIPDNQLWDESEEEDEYLARDDSKRDVDWYETAEKEVGEMPKRGYKKVGDTFVTKHDKDISQRSNGE